MALLSLQMAMGSSSPAAAGTLRKIADQPKMSNVDRARLIDLAERALAQHENTKVKGLVSLLDEVNDKMVSSPSSAPLNNCWRRWLTEAPGTT